MTKAERIHLTNIVTNLESVMEYLNEVQTTNNSKERFCIIYDQVNTLRGIISDVLKGGWANG